MSREFDEWLKRAYKGSADKIKESEVFLSLTTDESLCDPLCALQLGLAILLDKPILVLADHGQKVPENLARIAKAIARADINNAKDVGRAVKNLLGDS